MIIKPNTGHKVCSESQQRSLAVLTKYNTNVVNAAQGGGRDSDKERGRKRDERKSCHSHVYKKDRQLKNELVSKMYTLKSEYPCLHNH